MIKKNSLSIENYFYFDEDMDIEDQSYDEDLIFRQPENLNILKQQYDQFLFDNLDEESIKVKQNKMELPSIKEHDKGNFIQENDDSIQFIESFHPDVKCNIYSDFCHKENYTEGQNRSTGYKTQKTKIILIKKSDSKIENKDIVIEKKKIFNIIKRNKKVKLGRIPKMSNQKRKHNKNSKDNLKRKIKGQFISSLYNFILSKFYRNKEKKTGKLIKFLKKINPKQRNEISVKNCEKFLNKTVKDVFSVEISEKLTTYNKDFNKKEIEKIIKTNKELEVIKLLGKNIKELLGIYLFTNEVEESDEYKGFDKLEDNIKRLKLNNESPEFIQKYKETAYSLYFLN